MRIATIFCALLLLSLCAVDVSAASLSNLKFTANGQPILAVSPQHQQLVDLSFDVDLLNGYATLDLGALHQDPAIVASYRQRTVVFSSCAKNTTTNRSRCTIEQLAIMPANASVTIPYKLFAQGSASNATLAFTFRIDNSSPSVTKLTTSFCNEQRCFIGSNIAANITIVLEDAEGTFNKHMIFYQLGSNIFNAENCTGKTCVGTARITCYDGQPLDLRVVSANGIASQDDAGNPVIAEKTVRVLCDATPIDVVSVNVTGRGSFGLITEDSSFTITAIVRKEVVGVAMAANVSAAVKNGSQPIQSVKCTKTENDLQSCTLTVGNLVNGTNKRVTLLFTDDLGRTLTANLTLPPIFAVANASNLPNFFEAKVTGITPATIDRVALQLALDNAIDYPVFVTYKFTQLVPGARILKQELKATGCFVYTKAKKTEKNATTKSAYEWQQTPALFSDPIRVFSPNADWNASNRLDASFLMLDTQTLQEDGLPIRCNLTLTVEKDNVLYTVQEQETLEWRLKFRNSKLGTPGGAFITKINKEKEELNGGVSKLIGTANQITSTFAQVCQMQDMLIMMQMQGLSMESIGMMLMYTGAGQSIGQSGNGMWSAMMMSSMTYWMGKMPQTPLGQTMNVDPTSAAFHNKQMNFRKFCNYIHCDVAKKTEEAMKKEGGKDSLLLGSDQKLADSINAKGQNSDLFKDYFANMNTPDVSNSIIMSLATQCWSGVVYNLNKYRQIDCGYVQCLKEQALNGASITPCELGRGVKMCRFITGEVFELPYIRVVKNLAANINQLVQSPLTLLANKLNAEACVGTDKDINPKGVGCHVMKTLSMQRDFQSVTKYNQIFTFPMEADLCQKVLCEGDECEKTSSGFLEGLVPGTGYSGDLYRQQLLAQKEKEAKLKIVTTMVDNLPKIEKNENGQLTTYSISSTPDGWQSNEAYKAYLRQVGVDTSPDSQQAASLWEQLNNANVKKTATGEYVEAQNNRNIIVSEYANGHPITSGEQLSGLAQSGAVPGASLITNNALTNQAIADNLAIVSTPWQQSEVCQGDKINTVACKDKQTEYQTAVAQLYADSKYSPDPERPSFVCQCEVFSNGVCTKCKKGTTLDEATQKKAQQDAAAAGKSAQSTENFYGWVDMMSSVLYQYMREEGQLDFLFLSGWGDWGAELSAQSNKLLNPEEWKNNLCNPAGAFNDYAQDSGAVFAWQGDNYRTVLTFAGEKLRYETRAENPGEEAKILYTVSAVAVSPFTNNEMTIVLNPGYKTIVPATQLSQNAVTNKAGSLLDTAEYTEVCVVFTEPFPRPGAESRYCRPLQRNAYDRGDPTNEQLGDWGLDDPYSDVNGSSSGGSSFFGSGGNGVGFGFGGAVQ